MMIGLRPILSDSQPKNTKPTVAIASAMISAMSAVFAGTFSVLTRKMRA